MKFHLGENWSFKVRAKKSNLFGLKDFSLMHAERRNYLLEWYARKLYAEEGLIYKEYKFVNLHINGENKGIYVIDENFTEALSTRNNKREGIFVRFGSDINFFGCRQGRDCPVTDDVGEFRCCGLNDNLMATHVDTLNQQIDSNTKYQKIKDPVAGFRFPPCFLTAYSGSNSTVFYT